MSTTCVRESLDALASAAVDIAVIARRLPDGSGIEFVRACSRHSPSTRCVVTTVTDDDHFASVFAAGALGYLLMDQPETVLIQQMRLVADGVPLLAPAIAQRLVRHFMQQRAPRAKVIAHAGDLPDDLTRLSQRERQVLALIGKGMHITEVAHLLHITTNTVGSHVKSIYRKRNLSSRAEAALEAQRLGLV